MECEVVIKKAKDGKYAISVDGFLHSLLLLCRSDKPTIKKADAMGTSFERYLIKQSFVDKKLFVRGTEILFEKNLMDKGKTIMTISPGSVILLQEFLEKNLSKIIRNMVIFKGKK